MENLTIGQIVAALGSLSIIIGFVAMVYNFIKKNTIDRIDKNEKEIQEIKIEVGVLKSEIQDDKEEKIIILEGLLACLKGLQEQGYNDVVTDSISKIENYLMRKSHL